MSNASTPTTFPAVNDTVQVLTGGGSSRSVKVTRIFPEAFQFVGKLMGPSADPRGDYIVAELHQAGRWLFRHSLTPEQAGQRPLTNEERAAIDASKPKAD